LKKDLCDNKYVFYFQFILTTFFRLAKDILIIPFEKSTSKRWGDSYLIIRIAWGEKGFGKITTEANYNLGILEHYFLTVY